MRWLYLVEFFVICYSSLLSFVKDTISSLGSTGSGSKFEPAITSADYVNGIRGITNAEINIYNPSKDFICDKGKQSFPFSSVNDNYCDCADGTDEPGTSACSNGLFRCINKGYKPVKIFASRVDDGICDCCDGSDEGTIVQCSNQCGIYAEKIRAELDKAVNNFKSGFNIRNQYMEEAAKQLNEINISLTTIDAEENALRDHRGHQEQVVNQEESLDKLAKTIKIKETRENLESTLGLKKLSAEQLGRVLSTMIEVLKIDAATIADMVEKCQYKGIYGEESGYNTNNSVGGLSGDVFGDGASHNANDVTEEHYQEVSNDHNKLNWVNSLTVTEMTNCMQLTNSFKEEVLFPVCRHKLQDARTSTTVDTAGLLLLEIIYRRRAYKEAQYALLSSTVLWLHAFPNDMHADNIGNENAQVITDAQGNQIIQQKLPQILLVLDNKESMVQYVMNRMSYTSDECNKELQSIARSTAPVSTPICTMSETLTDLLMNGIFDKTHSKYDELTPNYSSAKSQLEEIHKKLGDITQKKSEAEKVLSLHSQYKSYSEFLALKDQCFTASDGKFEYSLCMFKDVRQKEMQSHNSVTLGSFSVFETDNNNGHIIMHFDKGTHCHAHGARRVDITATCGLNNILKEAREPSTCYYTLQFESPAACTVRYGELNGFMNSNM